MNSSDIISTYNLNCKKLLDYSNSLVNNIIKSFFINSKEKTDRIKKIKNDFNNQILMLKNKLNNDLINLSIKKNINDLLHEKEDKIVLFMDPRSSRG